MFKTIIRVLVIYLIVLLLVRIMGKRQIGEMQPFELVIMLIFADIATIPMADSSVPLLIGVVPLLTLVLLQFFLSLLCRKSLLMQKVINGQPMIVIDPNGINYKNLQALNMSLEDLQEALRGCGVSNFDQVQYGIIETNGKMSVILKSQHSPITPEIMQIAPKISTIPITLVNDGKMNKENMLIAKIDEDFIKNILNKYKIKSIKDVLILNLDNLGKVYLQTKKGNYTTLQTKYKGGKW